MSWVRAWKCFLDLFGIKHAQLIHELIWQKTINHGITTFNFSGSMKGLCHIILGQHFALKDGSAMPELAFGGKLPPALKPSCIAT